ncbi:MAG: 2-C-methyl-D-erythritol 2,4-cyclodiphosphate synthase, partial [Oscillospiraceae bacterium]
PHETGLLGHSDADVLLHAIMDSILGAMGMGDIGGIFPDTDTQFKNADSLQLLRHIILIMKKNQYEIGNIDCTIIAQKPKIKPYINEMKDKIASSCEISIDMVNIKATTEEGLGFTGNLEGIAAHSVCLIVNSIKNNISNI